MEQEEIRAEIQRRKRLARDLKLRETIWSLYKSQLKCLAEQLAKDPELILPEIRETLSASADLVRFRFNESDFCLKYVEGKKESERYGRDETDTTQATITLDVDSREVFQFNLRTSVTFAEDAPHFHESLGEINAFIEGQWIQMASLLSEKMKSHVNAVWKKRNAPRREQKLREEMKRFGL